MEKNSSKHKLKHITNKSIKIGDKFSKKALDNTNISSARIANQAYGNAVRAISALLLIKASK